MSANDTAPAVTIVRQQSAGHQIGIGSSHLQMSGLISGSFNPLISNSAFNRAAFVKHPMKTKAAQNFQMTRRINFQMRPKN
jgi:hypothetical protein